MVWTAHAKRLVCTTHFSKMKVHFFANVSAISQNEGVQNLKVALYRTLSGACAQIEGWPIRGYDLNFRGGAVGRMAACY